MLNAISGLLVFSVLFANQLVAQQRKPTTVSEISTYMGADREQLLYAGAKSEGVFIAHLLGPCCRLFWRPSNQASSG